jgi:type I restriction enzyme S subunit
MNYKTYPISDLIDEIAMGPFGSNIKVDCFVDKGIPVLNGSNLEGFELSEKSFRYVTEEKADSLKKANAHKGDVVITHRGTLGQIVYIPQTAQRDRYVISQSQFRVKCNKKVLPEYFVYYFHTPIGQHKLLSNASQVGVPALARPSSTFQKIEIEIPDLETQKKVVKLIGSLQTRIKTNAEINDNLHQQARTLLTQWQIKHEGEYDFSLLSDVAVINPDTYSPKDAWEYVNYLDTSSITDGIISEVQCIKPLTEKLPSRARRIISANDVVFSTVRPNQHHFGIITEPLENMLASTGFAVIRSRHPLISNELLYLCLTENSFIEKMQQLAEQSTSTFPSIKPSDLGVCKIPCPIDQDLSDALNTLFACITANQRENTSLSALRDTLLPKLMSGEIDVSGIQL